MAELMDVSAYARHRRVSRKTVYQWLQKGWIRKERGGMIDRDRADELLTQEHSGHVPVREAHILKPVSQAAVASVKDTLAEAGEPTGQQAPDDQDGPNGAGVTLTDARKAKLIQETHLTRLKVQQMRGELVDRTEAESRVFGVFRQERDAWLGWPSRVAPQMAADLQADPRAVQTVLEQYVHGHLDELGEVAVPALA